MEIVLYDVLIGTSKAARSLDELVTAQKELNRALSQDADRTGDAFDRAANESARLTAEIQKTKRAFRQGSFGENTVAGLRDRVIELKNEWLQATIGTDKFKKAASNLSQAQEQLKELEAQVGINTRSVGDYENAVSKALGKFRGVDQIKTQLRSLTTEEAKATQRLAEISQELTKNASLTKAQQDVLQREFLETAKRIDAVGKETRELRADFQQASTQGLNFTRQIRNGIFSIQASIIALAAGGGLFRSVIGEPAEADAAIDRVAALTRATDAQRESIQGQASELGRTTQFNTLEAAKAQIILAQAGNTVNQILEKTPAVLQLAGAAATDLATAADVSSNVLASYGSTVENFGIVNDQLAATLVNAKLNITEYNDAFKFIGPVARDQEIPLERLNALIGVLANRGFDASQVGTGLRQIIVSLINPTGQAAESLKRLGIEATDSFGRVKDIGQIVEDFATAGAKAQDVFTIFGDRGGSVFLGLQSAGKATIDAFTDVVKNSEGLADAIQEQQLDNLTGDFEQLGGAVSGLGEALFSEGEGGLRAVTQAATNFVGVLTSLVEFLGKNRFLISTLIVGYLALNAAVIRARIVTAIQTATIKANTAAMVGNRAGAALYATVLNLVSFNFAKAAVTARAFTVAMAQNPFGILIAAATIAIGLFSSFKTATSEIAEEIDRLDAIQSNFNAELAKEQTLLKLLTEELLNENTPRERRVELMGQINEKYKPLLKNQLEESDNLEVLTGKVEDLNKALIQQILINSERGAIEDFNKALSVSFDNVAKAAQGASKSVGQQAEILKVATEAATTGILTDDQLDRLRESFTIFEPDSNSPDGVTRFVDPAFKKVEKALQNLVQVAGRDGAKLKAGLAAIRKTIIDFSGTVIPEIETGTNVADEGSTTKALNDFENLEKRVSELRREILNAALTGRDYGTMLIELTDKSKLLADAQKVLSDATAEVATSLVLPLPDFEKYLASFAAALGSSITEEETRELNALLTRIKAGLIDNEESLADQIRIISENRLINLAKALEEEIALRKRFGDDTIDLEKQLADALVLIQKNRIAEVSNLKKSESQIEKESSLQKTQFSIQAAQDAGNALNGLANTLSENAARRAGDDEQAQEAARKKAFARQKLFSIAQIGLDLARIIVAAKLQSFALVLPGASDAYFAAQVAIASAVAAIQLAAVAAAKYRRGGVLPGPSHERGGVKLISRRGQYFGEAEGGETIMTKGVSKNRRALSVASLVNQAAGGAELGGSVMPSHLARQLMAYMGRMPKVAAAKASVPRFQRGVVISRAAGMASNGQELRQLRQAAEALGDGRDVAVPVFTFQKAFRKADFLNENSGRTNGRSRKAR